MYVYVDLPGPPYILRTITHAYQFTLNYCKMNKYTLEVVSRIFFLKYTKYPEQYNDSLWLK